MCIWLGLSCLSVRSTWRRPRWCREPRGCWSRTGPLCPALQVSRSPAKSTWTKLSNNQHFANLTHSLAYKQPRHVIDPYMSLVLFFFFWTTDLRELSFEYLHDIKFQCDVHTELSWGAKSLRLLRWATDKQLHATAADSWRAADSQKKKYFCFCVCVCVVRCWWKCWKCEATQQLQQRISRHTGSELITPILRGRVTWKYVKTQRRNTAFPCLASRAYWQWLSVQFPELKHG